MSLNHHRPKGAVFFHNSFIPEFDQHLQHVLPRIIIQTGADDSEAARCQYPAMQLVSLVLLVPLILLYELLPVIRSQRNKHNSHISIPVAVMICAVIVSAIAIVMMSVVIAMGIRIVFQFSGSERLSCCVR